jgi:hypothetical protein
MEQLSGRETSNITKVILADFVDHHMLTGENSLSELKLKLLILEVPLMLPSQRLLMKPPTMSLLVLEISTFSLLNVLQIVTNVLVQRLLTAKNALTIG